MTDAEIDSLAEQLEAILNQLRARKRAPAPAPSKVLPTEGDADLVKIAIKDAAFAADISESQMRRRCQGNVYGKTAGGYGYKQGSRLWEVVKQPFLDSLPLSERKRALERLNAH